MATIDLTFATNPQLTGAMVNDHIYYIDSSVGTSTLNDIIYMGIIQAFSTGSSNIIHVNTDPDGDGVGLNFTMPTSGDYIFFAKNNEINISALLGYYAEVKLVNDSSEEAELFSLSLGVEASSK